MELKWIKLATGIFDNRKIKQIELLPEGDTILIIWIKLLSLAGTINNNGLIYVTKDIPFTEDMLAGELRRPINTVRMALQTFQKFGMITVLDDNTIQITGWAKHQGGSVAIETAAEKNRLRQQRYRDKQKMLNAGQGSAAGDSFSNDSNVTRNVTDNVSNACRIEEEEKRNRNLINSDELIVADNGNSNKETDEIRTIMDAWNTLPLEKLRGIKNNRRKLLAARIKEYSLKDVLEAIEKVRGSPFLLGQNRKGWQIKFDWFVRPNNFPKVLEGNYLPGAAALSQDGFLFEDVKDEAF